MLHISTANMPLVATQLAIPAHYFTFNGSTSRAIHKLIERDAKRRAGSQLSHPRLGVIANHSQ